MTQKLAYQETGQGASLAMLHGWGMNSHVWQQVIPELEKRFRLRLIDLPGHGINRQIDANSFEEIVSLVKRALPEKTHLLGWSLGGMVARQVYHHVPDRIESLTLVASTPRFSQTENWPHGVSEAVLQQFADGLKQDLSGTIRRFVALQFLGSGNRLSHQLNLKALQRSLLQQILVQPADKKALEAGLGVLRHADLRDLLNNHSRHDGDRSSVHWLLGEKDRLIPLSLTESLKTDCPNDKVTVIKDAGHAPFMTHPLLFGKSVADFINSAVSQHTI